MLNFCLLTLICRLHNDHSSNNKAQHPLVVEYQNAEEQAICMNHHPVVKENLSA